MSGNWADILLPMPSPPKISSSGSQNGGQSNVSHQPPQQANPPLQGGAPAGRFFGSDLPVSSVRSGRSK